MAIPMLPILLEADFVLDLWLKEVPAYTSMFVKAMLTREVICASLYGLPQFIDATGSIKWFKIITSGVTILILPVSYLIFKLGYPPYAISYIYVISGLIGFVSTLSLLRIVLHYDIGEYLKNSTLRILIMSSLQIPVFISIRLFQPGWMRFIVISFVSEFILMGSILLIGMSHEERGNLISYAKEGMTRHLPSKARAL